MRNEHMHVDWDVTGYPCFYVHGFSGDQKNDEQLLSSLLEEFTKVLERRPGGGA